MSSILYFYCVSHWSCSLKEGHRVHFAYMWSVKITFDPTAEGISNRKKNRQLALCEKNMRKYFQLVRPSGRVETREYHGESVRFARPATFFFHINAFRGKI